MYHLYIIYSKKLDRFYTGHTQNLESRLINHNDGHSRYTSKAKDWKVVYSEDFDTRKAVIIRELEIKKKKSRPYIEYLVSTTNQT